MNSKLIRQFVIFFFLFIFTANLSLEARHSRRTEVHIINQQNYVTPAYYQEPVIVEQHYYGQLTYVRPVQTIVYREAPVVYREQVIVRERQSPASFFSSFALGLGFGLLTR